MIKCPDCGEEIKTEKEIKTGEIIECPNCGTELEVINLEPLEVAILEEEK
jgi:alpha-aminoadipate carrier protein LysW